MERDGTWGVELVPPPASLSWDDAGKQITLRDPRFDPVGFFLGHGNTWGLTRMYESASLFGTPPLPLDPLPTNTTDELRRKRAELVKRARGSGEEWVRQLSPVQTHLVSLTADQNWEAIILWENYIAELKLPGRDGPADAITYETPEWNATLAEYVTYVRRVGTRSGEDRFSPFTWLLHDIEPDPNAARRLTGPVRRLDAA